MPKLRILKEDNPDAMIEALFWKGPKGVYLGIIKNPTRQQELERIEDLAPVAGITDNPVPIWLEFAQPVKLIDLRRNRNLGTGKVFNDRLKPWEANVYRVVGLSVP